MGRPSKLTLDQWSEAERRMAAGEGVRALAREYGVDPSVISRRLSQQSQRVRNVAQQVAAAQNALAELPLSQQHAALSLAEKLRSVSDSMADVAVLGADTARHLHRLANAKAKVVTEQTIDGAADVLRTVAALTKMGNEAAAVPLGLISATKGKADEPPPDDLPSVIELVAPDVSSATADPA